jgi:hypothetical protein
MRTEDGRRLRACSTPVTDGLRVLTRFAATEAGTVAVDPVDGDAR